jgi:ribosomal protein L44E
MVVLSEEEFTKPVTLAELKLLKKHNLVFYCPECKVYHANHVGNSDPWIKINEILKVPK